MVLKFSLKKGRKKGMDKLVKCTACGRLCLDWIDRKIVEEDDSIFEWTCYNCGRKNKTAVVVHRYYITEGVK
jgi:hypothetical protein